MINIFKKASPEALAGIKEEEKLRHTNEVFLLIALGSQFDHLIKLALERLGVYCLIGDPRSLTAEDVRQLNPCGIILSGGPASVYSEPPSFDNNIFDLSIPVLGICLGFQMWAKHVGALVEPSKKREFGIHEARVFASAGLFQNCPEVMTVLESHGDTITSCKWIIRLAETDNALAAGQCGHLYGVQFHPEVRDTPNGELIFKNFCFEICGAKDRFPAKNLAKQKISDIQERISDSKVLLAISGGSDSSTVAYLLKEAVGNQPDRVRGVYIKGIDRPDDEAHVLKYFGSVPWLDLRVIDATGEFLEVLTGIATMPAKRKAMRSVYKSILEREAREFGADFIAQGTLYTDICESGGGIVTGARKAQIKQHHNTNLELSLPELTPLDDCVKDGGRNIGRAIGVPEELLVRHPFPGPGLVVRIEGAIETENLRIARQADKIYIEELRQWDLYQKVWQCGAVVTKSVTTCTKGDDAANGTIIALWAVWSVDGFTAQWAELPNDFLRCVSRRLTNEIREVGAVVYRISDKPPATIEWG